METVRLVQHLNLVLTASVATTFFGVVLGVLAYLFKFLRPVILWFVDLMQTIPVLALLGLVMVFFGPTSTTVIIGIVLYSLLPVVRNCYVGLENINPALKEAAQGMGMSKLQALLWVELPLALPIIFAGIRIAVCALITVTVIKLAGKSIDGILTAAVAVGAFASAAFLGVSPALIAPLAGVLGTLYAVITARKGKR